jgi:hypothetical protein
MSCARRVIAISIFLAGWSILGAAAARAADLAPYARTTVASANYGWAAHPEWPGVWLGHFTGGRALKWRRGQTLLAWQDVYLRFPTRAACHRWQHGMLAQYHGVQGYRTCLIIR